MLTEAKIFMGCMVLFLCLHFLVEPAPAYVWPFLVIASLGHAVVWPHIWRIIRNG